MPLASIDEILSELQAGRAIVLVDDEQRENEGDFVVAAEKITPEMVNFLTRIGGGYLCVALDGVICDRLELDLAESRNNARSTAFTVSVEGHPRHGIGTGVSAKDRATTIRLLSDPTTESADFTRPGHVNPLRERDGGVLVRTGQTEGSVDLCRLAGLQPAAAIIEIVKTDGDMARMPELKAMCVEHKLKMCSVEQVIQWRLAREVMVTRVEPHDGEDIETPEGVFRLFAWRSSVDALPHIAFTTGGVGRMSAGAVVKQSEPTLVRMHRRDIFSDVFGTLKNGKDGNGQSEIRSALRAIAKDGRGVLVYLRSEGSGFDLPDRLQRIHRPERDDPNAPDLTRPDGVAAGVHPMDLREFGVGGQILRDLGLTKLRLLTNHPKGSMPGLHAFGLDIVDQVKL